MSHTPFARFVGSDSTTSREALERLQKVETMRDELLEALKLHISAFDGETLEEIEDDYGIGTAARIHVARVVIAKAEGKS